IWLALFKFPEVPEIKTNAGAKAYNKLWEVDDYKRSKGELFKTTNNRLCTAVRSTVLNPGGKDIQCTEEIIKKYCAIFLVNKIPSKNDIMNIQDDSRDESNTNDYNDNNIEEHSENDTDED
ncbi:18487_t:CDS:2, partial [Racocetra fulgida]